MSTAAVFFQGSVHDLIWIRGWKIIRKIAAAERRRKKNNRRSTRSPSPARRGALKMGIEEKQRTWRERGGTMKRRRKWITNEEPGWNIYFLAHYTCLSPPKAITSTFLNFFVLFASSIRGRREDKRFSKNWLRDVRTVLAEFRASE